MVEMAVECGDDHVAVLVLKVSEQVLEMVLVVVIDQRDAPGNFALAELLPVFDRCARIMSAMASDRLSYPFSRHITSSSCASPRSSETLKRMAVFMVLPSLSIVTPPVKPDFCRPPPSPIVPTHRQVRRRKRILTLHRRLA